VTKVFKDVQKSSKACHLIGRIIAATSSLRSSSNSSSNDLLFTINSRQGNS